MEGEREPPLRELQEELSELRSLQKTRGYTRLLFIAEQQIEARVGNLVLNPLEKMDDVLKQEYAKGEIAGIKLFASMTDTHIATLENEIAAKLKKEEDHDNSEDLE